MNKYNRVGDKILPILKDSRIFSIEKNSHVYPEGKDQNKFLIREECDKYFYAILTKQELIDLANEILILAES